MLRHQPSLNDSLVIADGVPADHQMRRQRPASELKVSGTYHPFGRTPAIVGRYSGQPPSLALKRYVMLSDLLPVVVDAVWPDHIEIELRIEIAL
ncbi:MAG: hypothetical protein ABIG35_18025 [Pseudomonadota bacterium]